MIIKRKCRWLRLHIGKHIVILILILNGYCKPGSKCKFDLSLNVPNHFLMLSKSLANDVQQLCP